MTIDRHPTIELPGLRLPAAFAAALAMLMLGAAPASAEPEFRSVFSNGLSLGAGKTERLSVYEVFRDAGPNARFTEVSLSPKKYEGLYETSLTDSGGTKDLLVVTAMTVEQLDALEEPPPDPFYVEVKMEMTNDKGENAEGTIEFKTSYDRPPPEPTVGEDAPGQDEAIDLAPGATFTTTVFELFNDAGTDPRIAKVTLSPEDYYQSFMPNEVTLLVLAKDDEELAALDEPPSNPFTVTVTVKMKNAEGQTAEADLDFETSWNKPGEERPQPPGQQGTPVQTPLQPQNETKDDK